METLIHAKKHNKTLAEAPMTFVDRLCGESKLGANEIVLCLKGLFKLFLLLELHFGRIVLVSCRYVNEHSKHVIILNRTIHSTHLRHKH